MPATIRTLPVLGTASPAPDLVASVPGGTQDNDLMIIIFEFNTGTGTVITKPAGWTLILRTNNGADIGLATYWHVAASEPGSYTWSFTGGPSVVWGQYIVKDADFGNALPIDYASGNSGASDTIVAGVPILATGATELMIGCFGVKASTSFTPPSGMKEDDDKTDATTTLEVCHASLFDNSGSGPRIATAAVAGKWVSQLLNILNSRRIQEQLIDVQVLDTMTGDLALS